MRPDAGRRACRVSQILSLSHVCPDSPLTSRFILLTSQVVQSRPSPSPLRWIQSRRLATLGGVMRNVGQTGAGRSP